MRFFLFFLLLILIGYAFPVEAQISSLPVLSSDRRTDNEYMDSIARIVKQRYQFLIKLPQTLRNDTLRLATLNYLGMHYRRWGNRLDSTLYFTNQLIQKAHLSNNVLYELMGRLLVLEYNKTVLERQTPEALRANLEILDALNKASQDGNQRYNSIRYTVYSNLGDLYTTSRDYQNALHYFNSIRTLLKQGLTPNRNSFLIDVEQHLGALYQQQDNFKDSEEHYKQAELLLVQSPSQAEHAYVYDDLGELYLKFNRYEQAIIYSIKADLIWSKIRPKNGSRSWGILAKAYAEVGKDELALEYAQKVLQLPRAINSIREQAYFALHRIYERRNDWKSSTIYFKKYIATRDSIIREQRINELIAIQKQAEFDRINLQNTQTQQLQAQRILTIQKQAELDRLRANINADQLTRKARFSEQRRQFESERSKKALIIQKIAQQKLQQEFDNRVLLEENRAQRNWILFSTISSVLLFGVVLLLLYSASLRKQKTKIDLRFVNEQRETNAKIIRAQEEERQRIAADLHDDLGGTLATLRRRLTDLRQYFRDPHSIHEFDNLQPLLHKSSADLRRIAHNLMPPEFERIGLHYALEQLVNSQPLQPIRFSFFISGRERKLPLDIELNAYRIISEFIQNINKHSQAKRASIQLIYQDDRLTITTEDDGIGNRALDNKSIGIGLKTSNLRAEYIGATLWRDISEAGTFAFLDIPYPKSVYAGQSNSFD
ncbi:tetratricopeptide repeat protein [Spirosoma sp. BT702]|uniref:histidine kinase n=1 Tax=Spirosoma profusum TaxID=2771354 RepID=A0A926Y3G7_9BACT|nr:tetratricopeptide repeat-containing sensor histidine kinase [Spirosoma profusum]MBD2701870.1 tetratricopeptide repeat protein [Spirosoma profusum]